MKRSGLARRLRLGPFWEDADVNAAAAALLQANHSWTNLRALKIMIKQDFDAMELVSVHSMLVWLLWTGKQDPVSTGRTARSALPAIFGTAEAPAAAPSGQLVRCCALSRQSDQLADSLHWSRYRVPRRLCAA